MLCFFKIFFFLDVDHFKVSIEFVTVLLLFSHMKDVGCSLLNQGSDSTPALDEGVMSHWAAGEVPLEVKCGPEEVLEPLRRHRVSHWSGTWFWKTAGLGCVLLTSPCSKASSQFGSTLSWKQFSPG